MFLVKINANEDIPWEYTNGNNSGCLWRVNSNRKGTCKLCVIKSHQMDHRCVAYSNMIGHSPLRWFLVLTSCNCDVGPDTEAEKSYVYCRLLRFIRPFLRPEWSRAATSSVSAWNKKIWQVTWRSSALSLGPPPLYQKTPPFLLQLLARVCNRGTVSFPLSELSVDMVSKAALTGALTPVNAHLPLGAFKFKHPYTPATYLILVSKGTGRFRTVLFLSIRQLYRFPSLLSGTLFRGDVARAAGIARPQRQKSRAVLALLCSLVGCLLTEMNIIR